MMSELTFLVGLLHIGHWIGKWRPMVGVSGVSHAIHIKQAVRVDGRLKRKSLRCGMSIDNVCFE